MEMERKNRQPKRQRRDVGKREKVVMDGEKETYREEMISFRCTGWPWLV